jgi:hypothetical protein
MGALYRPEILGIQQAIISSISPEILMDKSRWMMRSINNGEATLWLTALKYTAPPEVFNAFKSMASEELPMQRWQTVRKAIA